jgi:hypothetical protein
MATLKSINRLPVDPDSELRERHDIASCSATEIHALADILIDRMSPDDEGRAHQSILRRIQRLAFVQLSALEDPVEGVASLRARLNESPEARHG